jgi:phosphonate transport system substrate-binding protein
MSVVRRHVLSVGLVAVLAAGAVSATGCGGEQEGGAAPGTLKVGLVPNLEPDDVKAVYEPLGDHLERELGMPVELTVPTSYPAVVEAMANDRLDLALFGGLTYVQARQRSEVVPLVTDVNPETGTTKYDSVIAVPADSSVRTVADLRGKTFAFGSPSSTSGSLYPSVMLEAAGIDYKRDLERAIYTGGHDATAAAVASGKVDAGGLEGRILRRLIDKGTVDGKKVRVIESSAPIEGYPWVARQSLDPGVRKRIARVFLELRDAKLLALLSAKGYERVEASGYDYVEEKAKALDLLSE